MREPTLYADGGTLGGSPGQGVYWSVAYDDGEPLVREQDTTGRRRWSDEAEYLALEAALRVINAYGGEGGSWVVYMDCRPVLRQVRSSRTPRRPRTRDLWWSIRQLLSKLRSRDIEVELRWVKRDELVRRLGH